MKRKIRTKRISPRVVLKPYTTPNILGWRRKKRRTARERILGRIIEKLNRCAYIKSTDIYIT